MDSSNGHNTIRCMCCFCGEDCGWEWQVYLTAEDDEQMWPCHFQCFSDALVPGARMFREEWTT